MKKSATPKRRYVLILRTCDSDRTGHKGFKWPAKGPVKCSDWNPEPVCGGGLHGFLWGEGDGSLASFATEARWLVVRVPESELVNLEGKVKFPRGTVVYCGDRLSATTFIAEHGAAGRAIVGGTAMAGDRGTATAGQFGTATAGDSGIIQIKFFDGSRYRLATAYVGENEIRPNTAYKLNEAGLFVPAK